MDQLPLNTANLPKIVPALCSFLGKSFTVDLLNVQFGPHGEVGSITTAISMPLVCHLVDVVYRPEENTIAVSYRYGTSGEISTIYHDVDCQEIVYRGMEENASIFWITAFRALTEEHHAHSFMWVYTRPEPDQEYETR